MGRNIEIKARCPNPGAIEQIIQKMNLPFGGVLRQTDTFYQTPRGRLKLRETDNESMLIPYLRKNQKGPGSSDYVLLPVEEPMVTHRILEAMFGVRSVVEKKRRIWFYENVRIHLDDVEDLGNFIELEGVVNEKNPGGPTLEKVELLMELFGIVEEDLIMNAYVDLMETEND